MRHILIAAAALAACGLFASAPASAQQGPTFQAGGAAQIAGWCKVETGNPGDEMFGYYAPCGGQALASEPRRNRQNGY